MHVVVLFCSCISAVVNGFQATLYTNSDWKGRSFDTGEGRDECINVPTSIQNVDDGVSSIDTHGLCVVVYDQENCRGRHVIMRPGTDFHGDFGSLHFNDQTKSVGPCVFNEATTELKVATSDRNFIFYLSLTLINLIICIITTALVLWCKRRRRPVLPTTSPPPLPMSTGESYEMSNYAAYEDIRNQRAE